MYLRVVAGVAAVAALPITTVYASEKSQEVTKETDNTVQAISAEELPKTSEKVAADNRLFRHQLPIYGEPAPAQFFYVSDKPGMIQEGIVPVRELLLTIITRCEKFINFASETEKVVSANLKDVVRYLREDAGAIPRAAFITVSGLGGLVAGYKGGMFRKMVYASAGMGAAASVCYPEQTIDISKRGWIITKEQAIELWEQNMSAGKKHPKNEDAATEKVEAFSDKLPQDSADSKDTIKVLDKVKAGAETPQKVDHGMSKPEDKDMYSTRTS